MKLFLEILVDKKTKQILENIRWKHIDIKTTSDSFYSRLSFADNSRHKGVTR